MQIKLFRQQNITNFNQCKDILFLSFKNVFFKKRRERKKNYKEGEKEKERDGEI